MNILRVTLNGEEAPNYTISKAFSSVFDNVETIWWQDYSIQELNNLIQSKVLSNNYDAVFMQIQYGGIITKETAKIISENTLGINWTGDVRSDMTWFFELGEHLLTLFTNKTDVRRLTDMGLKSDYLQVGYDHSIYFQKESPCHNNVVFCANFYPTENFPLTQMRKDMCFELKKAFGDKFNLYGGNWGQVGLSAESNRVNNHEEAEIYRTCGIAINCSHFNYSSYFSDRLLREMSCGSLVLSHNFIDYNHEFEDGKHFVIWNDFKDLIQKCNYYLENRVEAKIIGEIASKYVSQKFNWVERIKELKNLIIKYKK